MLFFFIQNPNIAHWVIFPFLACRCRFSPHQLLMTHDGAFPLIRHSSLLCNRVTYCRLVGTNWLTLQRKRCIFVVTKTMAMFSLCWMSITAAITFLLPVEKTTFCCLKSATRTRIYLLYINFYTIIHLFKQTILQFFTMLTTIYICKTIQSFLPK